MICIVLYLSWQAEAHFIFIELVKISSLHAYYIFQSGYLRVL